MDQHTAVVSVGHAIQLSVAPVFLLSAIAGMLAVLTNRLGRIIDHARTVEARLPAVAASDVAALHGHLATLSQRARLINLAITLCTITALLICAVVATIFVAAFLGVDASLTVAVLFVAAMSSFIGGLLVFLREVFIATAALRIGPR